MTLTIDRQLAQGNPVIAKVLFCGKRDNQYFINDPLGSGHPHQDLSNSPKGI